MIINNQKQNLMNTWKRIMKWRVEDQKDEKHEKQHVVRACRNKD
jgi:hypothetical protein